MCILFLMIGESFIECTQLVFLHIWTAANDAQRLVNPVLRVGEVVQTAVNARKCQLLKFAVQTDFMQQLGHFLVEQFQLFIFRVEYLLGRIFFVQQSVRIETEMYKGGVIFLRFILAAHLLVQIKHHALTAVRGADILRQTFLRMICRVRIKTAGIHTF